MLELELCSRGFAVETSKEAPLLLCRTFFNISGLLNRPYLATKESDDLKKQHIVIKAIENTARLEHLASGISASVIILLFSILSLITK